MTDEAAEHRSEPNEPTKPTDPADPTFRLAVLERLYRLGVDHGTRAAEEALNEAFERATRDPDELDDNMECLR